MFQSLAIRFDRFDQFDREFRENISQGGMFVPTVEAFELREVVYVDIELAFCCETVTLQAEVVSQVEPGFSQPGPAGVAVQFLEPTDELRARLSQLTGAVVPEPPPATWAGRPGRRHERTPTDLATALGRGEAPVEAVALNLSESGMTVALCDDSSPPTVGDTVTVTLKHSQTGRDILVPAQVVRQIEHNGRVAELAVEFDHAADGSTRELILSVAEAGQSDGQDGITGSIAALGLPNLLQMFCATADQGTLIVRNAGEEARILIESRGLRHTQVGAVHGSKALARVLAWREGAFDFQPKIAANEPEGSATPIDQLVLEALQHVDELSRLDLSRVPTTAKAAANPAAHEAEALQKLNSLESEVLDLAALGTTVGEILDQLPRFDSEIYEALLALLEQELIDIECS